ncbi:MAG: multiple sugar transport system substrate-binding protein [Burkholderiales bacterium]
MLIHACFAGAKGGEVDIDCSGDMVPAPAQFASIGSLSRRQFLTAGSILLGGSLLPACRSKKQAFPPVEGATSAERAVNAAKRFSGKTLNIGWETGDQAQDPLRFSGPLWEKLTGIRVNVVEIGIPTNMFRRLMAEHMAKSGAIDCVMVAPAWMPTLLAAGVLEPLDDYVDHYMVKTDLDDFLPFYQSLGIWDGRRFGLVDDGDTLLLYYRRDLFEDAQNQSDFTTRFGRPLGDPRSYDWQQFIDAASFFTDKFAPDLYGIAPFNKWLRWGWFEAQLRVNGGQFFIPATMKPGINTDAGRRTMANLADMDRFMPPGASDTQGPTALFASYLAGKVAMASFWPPLGRWAEAYGGERVGGVPKSQVAGKTGYALLPGGRTEMALGWLLAILANSPQKEAAYLFAQWMNSPEISLQRVMLPYSLRDPFRQSHIASPTYRALWPSAPAYLDTLKEADARALLDLTIPGAPEYEEAFYQAAGNVRLGMTINAAMDQMAAEWDAITERYGRDNQRTAYERFLRRQGAMVPVAGPRS